MNANRELRRLYVSDGLVGELIFDPSGNDDQQIGFNIDVDYSGFTNYFTNSQTYTTLEGNKPYSNLINSAPEALNTLKELADALNNDANYAATVQNQLNSKANQSTTYNKTEVDNNLLLKANQLTTYTKTEVAIFYL